MSNNLKIIAPVIQVVTPAYLEKEETIRRAIDSIRRQSSFELLAKQVVVFDGVTNLSQQIVSTPGLEVKVAQSRYNHSDYGDYIRRLGTRIAFMNNAFAVTFLDADNYWEKRHLEVVWNTHIRTRKNIVISGRKVLWDDGSVTKNLRGRGFFDTNTITLFGVYKRIGLKWGRWPKEMSLYGDRIFSAYLQKNFSKEIAFTDEPTVNYEAAPIQSGKLEEFKKFIKDNQSSVDEILMKNLGMKLRFGTNF